MFTATLFTIDKLWNEPRRPLTDEWIKKPWYIHPREYYSVIKKNGIMSFTRKWMELEIISEISQTETSITCCLLCVESRIIS
jgi:hypothetical protein